MDVAHPQRPPASGPAAPGRDGDVDTGRGAHREGVAGHLVQGLVPGAGRDRQQVQRRTARGQEMAIASSCPGSQSSTTFCGWRGTAADALRSARRRAGRAAGSRARAWRAWKAWRENPFRRRPGPEGHGSPACPRCSGRRSGRTCRAAPRSARPGRPRSASASNRRAASSTVIPPVCTPIAQASRVTRTSASSADADREPRVVGAEALLDARAPRRSAPSPRRTRRTCSTRRTAVGDPAQRPAVREVPGRHLVHGDRGQRGVAEHRQPLLLSLGGQDGSGGVTWYQDGRVGLARARPTTSSPSPTAGTRGRGRPGTRRRARGRGRARG